MQSSKRVCPRLYRLCVSSRLSKTCVSEHVKSRRPCVCFQHCSRLSTEAIPQPQVAGDDKQYSPKIQQIVHDISQLTLIETADLNDLLKKTLNIQDAPVMTYGGPAVAAPQQEEDEGPVKKEKTSFTVKLTKFEDGKKVQLIKEIKNLMEGMNLVQAKKFVESTPVVVKADIPKDEAEQLKAALVAAGGVAEVE